MNKNKGPDSVKTVAEARTGIKPVDKHSIREVPRPPRDLNLEEAKAAIKKDKIAEQKADAKVREDTAEAAQAALMLALELLARSPDREVIRQAIKNMKRPTATERAAQAMLLGMTKEGARDGKGRA